MYYLVIPFVKIHTIIVRCCCRTECSKLVFLLIRGLVTSWLDYGNTTLFWITDQLMHRLEMVWRSTVRIVMQTRRSDRQSMTTILQRLYWLPLKLIFVKFRRKVTLIWICLVGINGISIDRVYKNNILGVMIYD